MRAYWITFQPSSQPTALNIGAGITAHDQHDAQHLAAEAFGDLPIARIVEIENMNALDQKHVLPNIGNTLSRGIWFPQGYPL